MSWREWIRSCTEGAENKITAAFHLERQRMEEKGESALYLTLAKLDELDQGMDAYEACDLLFEQSEKDRPDGALNMDLQHKAHHLWLCAALASLEQIGRLRDPNNPIVGLGDDPSCRPPLYEPHVEHFTVRDLKNEVLNLRPILEGPWETVLRIEEAKDLLGNWRESTPIVIPLAQWPLPASVIEALLGGRPELQGVLSADQIRTISKTLANGAEEQMQIRAVHQEDNVSMAYEYPEFAVLLESEDTHTIPIESTIKVRVECVRLIAPDEDLGRNSDSLAQDALNVYNSIVPEKSQIALVDAVTQRHGRKDVPRRIYSHSFMEADRVRKAAASNPLLLEMQAGEDNVARQRQAYPDELMSRLCMTPKALEAVSECLGTHPHMLITSRNHTIDVPAR